MYETSPNTTGAHFGATIANVNKDTTLKVTYAKKYSGVVYLEETLFTVTKDGEGAAAGTWGTYTIKDVTVENESPLSTVAGPNKTYDPLDTIVIISL